MRFFRPWILLFALPAFADFTSEGGLGPLHIDEYKAAFGLSRRSVEYADLEPRKNIELWYGRPTRERGLLYLAKFNLESPPDLPVVSVEHFDPFLRYLECNLEHGHITFAFKYKKAFQQAIKAWSFVNQRADNKFLLLTHHDGCGTEEERHSFIISNVRSHAQSLTTVLTFQFANFTRIATTYSMDVRHVPLRPGRTPPRWGLTQRQEPFIRSIRRRVKRKDVPASHFIKDGQDITTWSKDGEDWEVHKWGSDVLPIHLQKLERQTLYNQGPIFSVSSEDVLVEGKLQFGCTYKLENGVITDVEIRVKPANFQAKATLFMRTASPIPADKIPAVNHDIFPSLPLGPDIQIGTLGNFGFQAFFIFGIWPNPRGVATFTIHFETAFWGEAELVFSPMHPERNNFRAVVKQWVPPQVTFDLQGSELGGFIEFELDPKIIFGLRAAGDREVSIGFIVQTPAFHTAFVKGTNKKLGYCVNDPGDHEEGLEVGTTGSFNIKFNTQFFSNQLSDQKLLPDDAITKPFDTLKVCFPGDGKGGWLKPVKGGGQQEFIKAPPPKAGAGKTKGLTSELDTNGSEIEDGSGSLAEGSFNTQPTSGSPSAAPSPTSYAYVDQSGTGSNDAAKPSSGAEAPSDSSAGPNSLGSLAMSTVEAPGGGGSTSNAETTTNSNQVTPASTNSGSDNNAMSNNNQETPGGADSQSEMNIDGLASPLTDPLGGSDPRTDPNTT